jgi:hypothetical protein
MMIRIASLLVVVLAIFAPRSQAQPAHRPNILWIVSEDNDPFLGCYGDAHARTPSLDKLAADGVLYLNAFSNAPVCAPSRCTLITGMYGSSLGTMHMRSQYQIPQDVRPFTQYLREAGYYCTNPGKKTDFNFCNWQPRKTYDGQGDWSGRKSGQPFFCVYNFMTTHESCLHGSLVHEEYLKGAAAAGDSLTELLNDPSPPVRIMAAEALCWSGHANEGLPALNNCLSLPDPMDEVLACNSIDALGEIAKPEIEKIKPNPPHGTEYLDHWGQWLSTKFERPAPLDTRR